MQLVDFGEGGLETVPLGLELFPALGLGEGVGEGGVVGPEAEFGERGFACEELCSAHELTSPDRIFSGGLEEERRRGRLTSNTLPTSTFCPALRCTPCATFTWLEIPRSFPADVSVDILACFWS